MKKLYFIRHGQTVMNVSGHFGGIIETPLTQKGQLEAKIAGQSAKDLGIDLIVASPLGRTLETARIIAKEIGYKQSNILSSPLLIERFFGELEGKQNKFNKTYDQIEGIESDNFLVQRAHYALDWINSLEADHILVVSHGSFGRAMRSILKSDYPMSHPDKINNAEILCWVEENIN